MLIEGIEDILIQKFNLTWIEQLPATYKIGIGIIIIIISAYYGVKIKKMVL